MIPPQLLLWRRLEVTVRKRIWRERQRLWIVFYALRLGRFYDAMTLWVLPQIQGGSGEIAISEAGGNSNEGGAWVGGVVPTSAEDVVALAAGKSGNLTINATLACRSFDLANYTKTLTVSGGKSLTIGSTTAGPGNLAFRLSAAMTLTAAGFISLSSTSATVQTVDFAGKSTVGLTTFTFNTGTYKLESAHTGGEVSLKAATLDLNAKTCSWANFTCTENSNRTLKANGATISLTGVSGELWKVLNPAKLTLEATGLTIKFTSNTNNARTFVGGGLTYGTLSPESTTGSTTITGSNTFAAITPVKKSVVKFEKGSTTTLSSPPEWKGAAGELITIESTEAGTAATLNCASGTSTNDYLKLKDIHATGGATFYAGSHSESVSGNEGWLFEDEFFGPPIGSRSLLGVGR